MNILEVNDKLKDICAVSGNEEAMSKGIRDILAEDIADITIDDYFNVICRKPNGHKKIMICTHLDEPGFIVDTITEDGFVKVIKVGKLDISSVLLYGVTIYGKKKIQGVIISRPPKLIDIKHNKEIIIDTGLGKSDLQHLISRGDYVSVNIEPFVLNNIDVISGVKSNMYGISILTDIARYFSKKEIDCELYFASTSQREIGCNGAIICANRIKPDLAIVIGQVTEIDDYMKNMQKESYCIGKGPIFYYGPYINNYYFSLLIDSAKNNKIQYQIEAHSGCIKAINEALQVSNLGIPTISIDIPTRYRDSIAQTICNNDVKNAVKILIDFIENLVPIDL